MLCLVLSLVLRAFYLCFPPPVGQNLRGGFQQNVHILIHRYEHMGKLWMIISPVLLFTFFLGLPGSNGFLFFVPLT